MTYRLDCEMVSNNKAAGVRRIKLYTQSHDTLPGAVRAAIEQEAGAMRIASLCGINFAHMDRRKVCYADDISLLLGRETVYHLGRTGYLRVEWLVFVDKGELDA